MSATTPRVPFTLRQAAVVGSKLRNRYPGNMGTRFSRNCRACRVVRFKVGLNVEKPWDWRFVLAITSDRAFTRATNHFWLLIVPSPYVTEVFQTTVDEVFIIFDLSRNSKSRRNVPRACII
jgi:hypothetical protein